MNNWQEITGIALLIVAILMAFWNRITGNPSTTADSSSGSTAGGNSAPGSSPLPEDVTGPGWIPLDYSGSGSLDNAPQQVSRWAGVAKRWADELGLPWEIILAQIWRESWGDPDAIGANDDHGLMQVTQGAVDDLRAMGYSVPPDWMHNPTSNIEAGAKYLHLQFTRTGVLADALGRTRADSLEAYNEGYAGARRDTGPDQYSVEVIEKANKLGYEM